MSTQSFPLGFISNKSNERVNRPDITDISRQLEELRLLEDGWLDGEGLAPSHDGLDWLSQALGKHYPDVLPRPHLYPTEEGGTQIEWSLEPNEVTLRVDLKNRVGRWHMLNMEAGTETSHKLNLRNSENWVWIKNRIQQISEGKQ